MQFMSYWLFKKMSKIVTLASLFVMVVAVEPGLNYDGYLDFQTTNVAGDFESAKSGCNSSALAVRDSATQMALTDFLNRSKTNSLLYINIKLHRNASDTWFLVNGSRYFGSLGNQDNKLDEYKLYGYLKLNPNNKTEFLVEASNPTHLKNFICDFEGSTCPNNSANNFTFKERCFVKYEDENLTWYKARESCVNKGGDLAKFQSGSNPWIAPFNTSWLNSSLTYWIGIRYNEWSWKSSVDDKEVINTFWSNGKPNNSNYECVCVDPNGSPAWSWTDCDCTVERPFVCLKIVPTTTTITTTPTTITTKTSITTATTKATSSATDQNTDNGSAPSSGSPQNNLSRTIGLGAGIGGGLLLILIVVIIVLIIFIVRRNRERKSGSESRLEMESEGDTQHAQVVKSDGKDVYSVANEPKWNPASNGVYASVIPNGKLNADLTEPPTEIIYSAPDFIQNEKPMPFDSNYAEATPVRDDLHTLRRNTDSIYPQSCHDLYENIKQSS